jgi:D-serine deaminase-like pyridoxal phosphate-dependent protein
MFDATIGRRKSEITTPGLVVDLEVLDYNIEAMRSIVAGSKASYRPHAKTHKMPMIAHKQIAAGAVGICCTKLSEAEVMVAGGVGDILLTSPLTAAAKISRLASLARHARLAVVVDTVENVDALSEAAGIAGSRLGVVVEIDVGQGRCGVSSPAAAVALAQRINRTNSLEFRGLQGYQGSIQLEPSVEKRRVGAKAALDRLYHVAEHIHRAGLTAPLLTGGGTGTLAIDIELGGLTELQPGSYVYMDSRYVSIEWPARHNPPFRSSLTVLATVLSKPAANRIVVDTGWKAISNDGGNPVPIGHVGARFRFAGDEHGILEHDERLDLAPGDVIELMPSHCDTTVNLYDYCYAIRADKVEAVWAIPGRGKTW